MAPLLHRAAIKKERKKLQGKNIMAPLLHRAAIKTTDPKSYVGLKDG